MLTNKGWDYFEGNIKWKLKTTTVFADSNIFMKGNLKKMKR